MTMLDASMYSIARANAVARRVAAAPPASAVVVVFLIMVAVNRAWLFSDYRIPAIYPDSSSYFAVAESLGSGGWPNFTVRPPVYPLFLDAAFAICDRVMSVVTAQTIVSAAAGAALTYALWSWAPWLGWPAALTTAGYLWSNAAMEHDTALLSESVYASLMMLTFSALLLGCRPGGGWKPFAAASTSMALAIQTRPAGVFLIPVFGLTLLWLIVNRVAGRSIVAFAVPLPLVLLLACTYNFKTVRIFAVTAWGEANLAVATFTWWQTDPAYPLDINRQVGDIQQFIRKRFAETGTDPAVIERSWDPRELSRAFVLGFDATPLEMAMRMGGQSYETTGRAWIRRIGFDSTRKRPMVYARFVYAMLFNYFHPAADVDFRSYLMDRVYRLYVERLYSRRTGNPFLVRLAKEFADGTLPAGVVVTDWDPRSSVALSDRVRIAPTRGWRVYDITHRLRTTLFSTWLWPALVPFVFFYSTILLVTSRGRNAAVFGAWILIVSALSASLVVSLVEYSQPRYSYPMEWTYPAAILMLLAAIRGVPAKST